MEGWIVLKGVWEGHRNSKEEAGGGGAGGGRLCKLKLGRESRVCVCIKTVFRNFR